jgi:hypothetical protein
MCGGYSPGARVERYGRDVELSRRLAAYCLEMMNYVVAERVCIGGRLGRDAPAQSLCERDSLALLQAAA